MVKKSKRIQERDAALGALGAGNSDGIEVQNDSASTAAHQEGDVEQSSRRGKGGRAKGSSNGNRGPRNDGTDNENEAQGLMDDGTGYENEVEGRRNGGSGNEN